MTFDEGMFDAKSRIKSELRRRRNRFFGRADFRAFEAKVFYRLVLPRELLSQWVVGRQSYEARAKHCIRTGRVDFYIGRTIRRPQNASEALQISQSNWLAWCVLFRASGPSHQGPQAALPHIR